MSIITRAPPIASRPRTLVIGIAAADLEVVLLDPAGVPVSECVRTELSSDSPPGAVLPALWDLVETLGEFDRISVGFPGEVVDGVTTTVGMLDDRWRDFALATSLATFSLRPARVANGAELLRHAVIRGTGVELVLTLGSGLGSALFCDGRAVPGFELAHHQLRKGNTYAEYVAGGAIDRVGKRKWNKRVRRMIEEVLPVWNPRRLYLAGRNAKYVQAPLPELVELVSPTAVLVGGIALWRGADPVRAAPAS